MINPVKSVLSGKQWDLRWCPHYKCVLFRQINLKGKYCMESSRVSGAKVLVR